MRTVTDRRAVAPGPVLYGAWITDRNGMPHYSTVRSTMGAPHVRLEVQRRAIAKYGPGFTFSVRPL